MLEPPYLAHLSLDSSRDCLKTALLHILNAAPPSTLPMRARRFSASTNGAFVVTAAKSLEALLAIAVQATEQYKYASPLPQQSNSAGQEKEEEEDERSSSTLLQPQDSQVELQVEEAEEGEEEGEKSPSHASPPAAVDRRAALLTSPREGRDGSLEITASSPAAPAPVDLISSGEASCAQRTITETYASDDTSRDFALASTSNQGSSNLFGMPPTQLEAPPGPVGGAQVSEALVVLELSDEAEAAPGVDAAATCTFPARGDNSSPVSSSQSTSVTSSPAARGAAKPATTPRRTVEKPKWQF